MTMRPLQTLLVGALALTTACAGVTAPELREPALDHRLASIGNIGARSNFEIRTLYAAPEAPQPAPAEPQSDTRKRRGTTALFFLGLGVAAIAGASAIGTGVAAAAARRDLDSAYFDEALSFDDFNARVDRGERLDRATKGLAALGGIGLATALLSYGIDWIRCGPLAPKRRRATAPAGRCRDSEARK